MRGGIREQPKMIGQNIFITKSDWIIFIVFFIVFVIVYQLTFTAAAVIFDCGKKRHKKIVGYPS